MQTISASDPRCPDPPPAPLPARLHPARQAPGQQPLWCPWPA